MSYISQFERRQRFAIKQAARAARATQEATAKSGRPCVDETGKRFGLLVVVSRVANLRGGARWLCECDCGRSVIRLGVSLRKSLDQGYESSCGCSRRRPMRPARPACPVDPAPFDVQEDIREEFLALSWAAVQRYTQ